MQDRRYSGTLVLPAKFTSTSLLDTRPSTIHRGDRSSTVPLASIHAHQQ
jgi:hypothetical protein